MKAACLLLWSVAASLMVHCVQSQVLGDVFLYEAGKGEKEPVHFDPFPDLPADFGPEVPDEGIDGLLFVADPEDACEPLTNRYDDEPWVALISRSQHAHPTNCTFDVKVHNAELAGAAAAIVYDDVYEALIIMSKPRDHDDPGIPAVFVSEKAGIIMRKLMTPGVTRVRIVPVSASAWMSLLMSAFLGFLALTVVLATFYVMRSWSMWLGRTRRRGMAPELAGFGALGAQAGAQEGLPACAIRALPILIYEGKPSKHRRSSTGSTQPPPAVAETLDAAGQRAPSAPVPIAAPAAAADNVAWLAGSPAMPETPQALAAGEDVRSGQHAGQRRSSAADTAVVLIESDSEGDTSGARRQQEQQQASGLGQRLATSSSAVTSGLISLASLAAAGSRRVLLLGGHGSPSSSAPGDSAAMAAAAAAAAGHPCGHSSSAQDAAAAVNVPGAAAATAADGGTGSGCATPTGSMSCRSSLYSTDDEDGDLPEVVQSWPGAGGMARVVTGGPVGARGGATRHTCVVCLERYSAGDKIRVLPCQHRFHAKCIDPWLASRRLCPVCKHDASTWPSNSLQAALSGPVPLDTPAPAAAAAAGGGGGGQVNPSMGGVNLLSAPLSAGVVSLAGRGYWFRRLRARLARASRRRQQQQQHEQQQLLAAGGVGLGMGPAHAAAAVAEAAEAGLLQPPPAAVTVDVRQGLQPVLSTQLGSLQQQEPQLQVVQQGEQGRQQQQQQQQQRSQQQRRRGQQQRQGSGLQEPLLPAQ